MEKLFLTGPIGIGKTTVLQRALAGQPLRGFCSYKAAPENGEATIWLADAADAARRQRIAQVRPDGDNEFFPEVFEDFGASLLSGVQGAGGSIVLMDEIGYIESYALRFQREIERVLALDVPVAGVLRFSHTPFLDRLFARKDLTIIEVTEQNRDALVAECRVLLGIEAGAASEFA